MSTESMLLTICRLRRCEIFSTNHRQTKRIFPHRSTLDPDLPTTHIHIIKASYSATAHCQRTYEVCILLPPRYLRSGRYIKRMSTLLSKSCTDHPCESGSLTYQE